MGIKTPNYGCVYWWLAGFAILLLAVILLGAGCSREELLCSYCGDFTTSKRGSQLWEDWFCPRCWSQLAYESEKEFGNEWSRERMEWIKDFAKKKRGGYYGAQ